MEKRILTIFIFTALLGMTAGCTRAADIGKDKATEIALEDAGYTQSDITRLHVSRDEDDGKHIYEVVFTAENMEYEYEIQTSDGDILSSSYDSLNTIDAKNQQEANQQKQASSDQTDTKEQSSAEQTPTSQGDTQITIAEASKLALDRVPGSSEKDLKIELDYDDGIYKYEGDIIYNQTEYEFEIDANTGNFLEWSEERR